MLAGSRPLRAIGYHWGRARTLPSKHYLSVLDGIHEKLRPRTYLEIGVSKGNSLALARSASVGIDPRDKISTELRAPTRLFWETSDDYFKTRDPLEPFDGEPIALGFIDGKHLIEFALRDFINVERHSDWAGVIVVDDVLPRSQREGARERDSDCWAGDVYKIAAILAQSRPDLICLKVRTRPTGLLLVLGLDPGSTTLADNYDRIIEDLLGPDREAVPASVLRRRDSLSASAVLSASFWDTLRDAGANGTGREDGLRALHAALREDFGADRSETG